MDLNIWFWLMILFHQCKWKRLKIKGFAPLEWKWSRNYFNLIAFSVWLEIVTENQLICSSMNRSHTDDKQGAFVNGNAWKTTTTSIQFCLSVLVCLCIRSVLHTMRAAYTESARKVGDRTSSIETLVSMKNWVRFFSVPIRTCPMKS